MMRIVQGYCLADCHKQLLELLIRTAYRTRDGKLIQFPGENHQTTIEAKEMVVHCTTPTAGSMFVEELGFSQDFMDKYAHDLIYGSPAAHEYSYHERLQKWSNVAGVGAVNQINYVLHKLVSSPTTRRAVATTWYPNVDEQREDVPCLQLIHCDVREGKLNMKVVFRSEDMVLGAGPNMYGLVRLQETIADHIDALVGTYTHVVFCPHVYVPRDVDVLDGIGIQIPGGWL